MSIKEAILEKLETLPVDKQQRVLEFAQSLEETPAQPRQPLKGILAGRGIHITEEDIAEARREMWGNFPRDLPND